MLISNQARQRTGDWISRFRAKCSSPFDIFVWVSLVANDTLSGPDLKSKYVTALFFAMTSLTSVGFGNVAAVRESESFVRLHVVAIASHPSLEHERRETILDSVDASWL